MIKRNVLALCALMVVAGALLYGQDVCATCANATPRDAWAELLAGNQRFTSNDLRPRQDKCRMACTAKGQKPYAVVLTCSDSRVPPELLFDQRIGDVFVVRVAGNVASDEAVGSIEYALEHLGSPKLVVVLGHEECGAVGAALAYQGTEGLIPTILNRIFPAVASIPKEDPDRLRKAVQENVRLTVKLLTTYSPIIREKKEHGTPVIGAYYGIKDGKVTPLE